MSSKLYHELRKEAFHMLQIVQLQDGCYRVTLDVVIGNNEIHRTWTFAVTESTAEPDPTGEYLILPIKVDLNR